MLKFFYDGTDEWARRAGRLIAEAVVGVVAGLTYVRLYFGIDFTDESFYIAVPYRFILGARPLVDETNLVQQPAGLLLYLPLKLYDSVMGSGGIVLFARHLHYSFSVLIGLALFVALRRSLRDRALAAIAASAAVAFVPFGIHGLSYNTFASGFFAAGLFLGLAWLLNGSPRYLAAAGAAYGLAVFVYPTFAAPVFCAFLALYFMSRPRSLRDLVPGLVPVAVCTLATVLFFVHEGLDTTRELMRGQSRFTGQGGLTFDKAEGIVEYVRLTFPHKDITVALLALTMVLHRLLRPLSVLPLLALPLTALPPEFRLSDGASNQFVTNLALLAPFVFLLVRTDKLALRMLCAVWLPAAVAGMVTALSSANGGKNLAIGFFAGSIVTVIFIALSIRATVRAWTHVPVAVLLRLLPAVLFVGIGLGLQYSFVYRDDELRHLTERVPAGPYAGLSTTPYRVSFLSTLRNDLAEASDAKCRILFYSSFPAGYLLGAGRPATNAAWVADSSIVPSELENEYQMLLIDYYARRGGIPDVAVRLNYIPGAGWPAYDAASPLESVLNSPRYVRVQARPEYLISRRVDADCSRGEGGA